MDLKPPVSVEAPKINEPKKVEARLEGEPLEKGHRIIALLVHRLGGEVEITNEELAEVEGLSEYPNQNGMKLTSTLK